MYVCGANKEFLVTKRSQHPDWAKKEGQAQPFRTSETLIPIDRRHTIF
jgi:hypothetical protein